MSERDPDAYLRLAALNLKQGERETAASCLSSALEAAGDDQAVRARVADAAEEALAELDPGDPALARLRWVAAQARGLVAAEAPPSREAIADVVQRLLAVGLEVTKTAQVGLDLVVEATGAERGYLVLTDRSRTAIGSAGAPPRPPQASEGIIAEALASRGTVVVGDALEDPRFANRDSVQAFSIRSVLCIPLLAEAAGEEPLGVFYLEVNSAPARFGPEERALAEHLAAIVAPALANARRFSEQRDALARAERLYAQARESELRVTGGVRLLGNSPAMHELQRMIEKVARVEHTILIEGESGTGKELVARAIHERSARGQAPFVAENMGALAEGLLEAELFGHAAGAFTGATEERPGLFRIAEGGTLLLDEIGEMDPSVQAKLLRVLQEREIRPVGSGASLQVDVRILAATHRDLASEVQAGRFREDLYYRLSVIRIRVPPLRERKGDVPLLLEHFLAQQAAELQIPPPTVSPQLLAKLEAYAWPGNVRELQGYAARLLIAGASAELGGEVPARSAVVNEQKLSVELALSGDAPLPMREARTVFDRGYLELVLDRFNGNVSASAKALELNRSYLSELVKRYRLKG